MRIRALLVLLLMLPAAGCATGPRPIHIYERAERNYGEAQAAYGHADYARAGVYFDAAFAGGYQPSPWDLARRAVAYSTTHAWAEGEVWIRTYALQRFPRFAPLLELRAECLMHLPGRSAEAESVAREALTLDPDRCVAAYVLDHSMPRLRACQASGRRALLARWQSEDPAAR